MSFAVDGMNLSYDIVDHIHVNTISPVSQSSSEHQFVPWRCTPTLILNIYNDETRHFII